MIFNFQIDSSVISQWAAGECDNCTLLEKTCVDVEGQTYKCHYFFNLFEISDLVCGIILLVISLLTLCISLLIMVKTLNALLKGNHCTFIIIQENLKKLSEQVQF